MMPAWAALQRRLIDTIDAAAPIFLEKYTRPGGALIWQEDYPGDGVWADDLYEAFFNWPLYHALGGSDYTGNKAVEEWNAVTRQITTDYGRAHKEFISDDDWFHNAENYIYFYYLGMADPTNRDMLRRARRFAGFYMNEDPEVPNYDAGHRIIRSPFSGSVGPRMSARFADVKYNLEYGHTTLGREFDYPENWHEDSAWVAKVHARFDEVVMNGDVVVNLSVVPLVATAFLYTGESKYRDWIVEYVEAWMERVEANDGIVPDNIGPTGKIGEQRHGDWWGGFYGWTGRYGHQMMGSAITIAAEAALLVTGDRKYLQLLRGHVDTLIDNGRAEDGRLLVPHNHTNDGWGEFRPIYPHPPVHLWASSTAAEDWNRLEVLREGCADEWRNVSSRGPRSLDDRAWTRYLAGDLPDYPEEILQANYQEVVRRLDVIIGDQQDLTRMDVHHWQQVNPVITEALVHLTTGGPQTIYWGGMAQGKVRYFDPAANRAGLPADVAALVSQVGAGGITLTLVNLSAHADREVIIGAGSFGEHRFGEVTVDAAHGDCSETIAVNDTCLTVDLRPGTEIELQLGMSYFCQQPSYAFPWHSEGVPVR
jgi:hypothetical protein